MLICFALKEEAAPFRKITAGKAVMVQAGFSIHLAGIGRQNAAKYLCDFSPHPNLQVFCGNAGKFLTAFRW
jgi:hypothetical protein